MIINIDGIRINSSEIYRYEKGIVTEVVWKDEYGVKALNRDNLMFDLTSALSNQVVVIYDGVDEQDISDELFSKIIRNGWSSYDYALYEWTDIFISCPLWRANRAFG